MAYARDFKPSAALIAAEISEMTTFNAAVLLELMVQRRTSWIDIGGRPDEDTDPFHAVIVRFKIVDHSIQEAFLVPVEEGEVGTHHLLDQRSLARASQLKTAYGGALNDLVLEYLLKVLLGEPMPDVDCFYIDFSLQGDGVYQYTFFSAVE